MVVAMNGRVVKIEMAVLVTFILAVIYVSVVIVMGLCSSRWIAICNELLIVFVRLLLELTVAEV